MYAQMFTIRTPLGKMDALRSLIESEYLPSLRSCEGFISAYLMEQADDPEVAQLIQTWTSQAAAEQAQRTSMLTTTVNSLAAKMQGLRIQRQSYVIRIALDAQEARSRL